MEERAPDTAHYDAVVVGAGIAGLYQLYRLRELGLAVKVFDAADGVGGTWYWNCYPGARVDSMSHVYQYWFSDELIQEWDWKERFPTQPEMERYLNHAADKFRLRDDIQFNTRVESASWDERNRHWSINTDRGDRVTATYFVSCSGMLSAPHEPPFPGHETFKGPVVHTARYPREGIELSGKKVGVVGTGATGIQVIQTIAPEVDELVVFQRTAQYGVAMNNWQLTDEERAHFKAIAPELKERVHHTFGGLDFNVREDSWHDHTKEERREILEEIWADGTLRIWLGQFLETVMDEAANEEVSEFVREKIRARIEDPRTAELLVPTRFGFGTYRVPLETSYYDAFNRSNVKLVDARKAPIEAFTETGLRTSEQEYELDIIILATGFDAGTGSLSQMNIHGRNGQSLKEEWQRDIRSTMGLQVAGYPNLFTVAGPLAPATAFCNMTTCLQQQVDWITDCITFIRKQGKKVIDPTEAKQDEWVEHHDEVANSTLLMNTHSWYTGDNIEGKPRRLLSYIGGVGEYRRICDEVKDSGYQGFSIE